MENCVFLLAPLQHQAYNPTPVLNPPIYASHILFFEERRQCKAKREGGKRQSVDGREIDKGSKCGIIEKREHKSTELSADHTEEDKNLWFLWFHQHD